MRTPTMSRRVAGALVTVVAAAACTATEEPGSLPTLPGMLRALGSDAVGLLVRGHYPGRSGDVVIVPEPGNTVAEWPRGLRGENDPRTTHAAPWDYLARVPIMLYGPGYIREGVVSDRTVDVADIPATFAELLGFEWEAQDGTPLTEALEPPRRRGDPPRVIVLVVYDGGGWNLLEHWPEAWPRQRALGRAGTTYTNATVGSAPTLTAAVHTTMGTGTYPRTHGMPENTGRRSDGSLGEMFFEEGDPRLIEVPTLGDEWDRANGNRPWVGMLGFDTWHLGMMSRGTRNEGADRDVAVLWEDDPFGFWVNEELYALPDHLPGQPNLDRRIRELDERDGSPDGRWTGGELDNQDLIPGTPAFVRHQGDALLGMLAREPIGTDALTDLLFVEMKPTDTAGHFWNMLGAEMEEVLRAQDRVLGELVAALDRRVGPGRWVLGISADHGQSPRPDAVGGLRIDRDRMQEHLEGILGGDLLEAVHPVDIYLDLEEVEARGLTVEQVARIVADIRFRHVAPEGTDLDALPPRIRNRRVFAAAIPGDALPRLRPAEIEALGAGRYPEADLTGSGAPSRFARLLG